MITFPLAIQSTKVFYRSGIYTTDDELGRERKRRRKKSTKRPGAQVGLGKIGTRLEPVAARSALGGMRMLGVLVNLQYRCSGNVLLN